MPSFMKIQGLEEGVSNTAAALVQGCCRLILDESHGSWLPW